MTARAKGPIQMRFQLSKKGRIRLANRVSILEVPKLPMIIKSPFFLRAERDLTNCLESVITTAGTMVEKNAMYPKYSGPIFIITLLPVLAKTISLYKSPGW